MSRFTAIYFGLLLIPNSIVLLGHGQILNENVASSTGMVANDGGIVAKDLMFKRPRKRSEMDDFLNRCNNLIMNGDAMVSH